MRARRAIVVAMVALLSVLVVAFPRSARACGHGTAGYGLTGGDLGNIFLVGAGISVAVVGDVMLTGHDAARAGPSQERDVNWSKGETYFATPQMVAYALLPIVVKDLDFPGAVALVSWPAALMVHGFYATNGDYGARWQLPIGIVGALDGSLLAYGVAHAVTGERPSPWFSFGEFLSGLAQTSFGVVYAAETGGVEARNALLMSLVPAAMMTHAMLLFAAPEPAEPPPKSTAARHASSIVPAAFVVGARGVAPGVSLSGTF